MQINQANVEAIQKGFSIKYDEGFSGAGEPLSARIMDTMPASAVTEEHDFLTAFPGIRELTDEVTVQNLRQAGYTIRQKEFESTIGLKMLDVLGDRLGMYVRNSQTMGAVARQHPDELLVQLLSDGLGGATDYTGSGFFDTDKAAYAGATTFTNVTTGRLTVARYAAGLANLKARQNAKGRPMGLGKALVLVVSPSYEQTAREIINAGRLANGQDNVLKDSARLEVWPHLATNDMEHTWFLMETGSVMKPFIRTELAAWQQYQITDPKDSYVVLNKKFLWQVYGVSNVGFCMPEMIYGSDGTVS
jgi:phage major head subunit gpT-like protein